MQIGGASRCEKNGLSVSWSYQGDEKWYSPLRARKIRFESDGAFHIYNISVSDDPSWRNGIVSQIRLLLPDCASQVKVDYIRFL